MLASRCPRCGAPSPISLAEPQRLRCAHCAYDGRPLPDAEQRMLGAVEVLRRSDARARQIDGIKRAMIVSGNVVRGCTTAFAVFLGAFVGLPVLFVTLLVLPGILSGWKEKVSWLIGMLPLPTAILVGGLGAAWLIRRAVQRIERASAANPPQRPGEPAGCHVCGAPLAGSDGQAVVRCSFCSSDNVVTRAALEHAARRRDVHLDDYARAVVAESLAVPAFSAIGCLGWLATVMLTSVGSCAAASLYESGLETETGPHGVQKLRTEWKGLGTALDGGEIFYCTRHGGIEALPKAGGPSRKVSSHAESNSTQDRFALDATHVYWVTNRGSALRAEKRGGAPALLGRFDDVQVMGTRLAVDEQSLFVTAPLRIARIPTAGGAAETVVTLTRPPREMTLDAASVFFLEEAPVGQPHRLARVAKSGGAAVTLQESDSLRTSVTPIVDETFVYYVANYGSAVNRIPKAGGAFARVAESTETDVTLLAQDATHVYFASRYDSLGCSGSAYGKLRRFPKAGGAVETLTEGLKSPHALLVDAEHVYFADLFRETLTRMPKR